MRFEMTAGPADEDPGWQVVRVDLRAPVSDHAWRIARVELYHPARGRVTEIGSAPGAFDAAFAAAGHILDCAPALLSYRVTSSMCHLQTSLIATVEVELARDGETSQGRGAGPDLIHASLEAWLQAARAFGR